MSRYEKISIFKTGENRQYKTNPIYPDIPESLDDVYIIASEEDRYDILAKKYYNDSSLWWVIASSNNHQRASLKLTPGAQIRIPGNIDNAIRNYNSINKSR